ncbi:MAG: threonylcarbamoyl-AMP synthase [Phycisphaerae bacterium]|nr:threonylcarbamoyl-AMP synthase [Phycisphaerae bacterium]
MARAVERLRAGGLVAFATETVYGLGADAFNPAAIDAVYALKGRPAHNPLIVHVTGADMARRVVASWTDEAERLARAFWPGPLSIVLPRAADLPAIVTAGGPNVAVRCPDHPTALALLFEFGGPLVGPSANPSGRVSPTTAEHVRQAFGPDRVMVLDGGPCATGIESTVVSLAEPVARVLRPGVIGPAAIARALGRAVELGARAPASGSAPLESPGLLDQHYAPEAEAVLFDEHQWPAVLAAGAGRRIAVVSHWNRPVPAPHRLIVLPATAGEYAAMLYAALREADRPGGLIAVERPPVGAGASEGDAAVWQAVADRLRRATRAL